MLISIPISTYNRAEYLKHIVIPSILKQTYKNFEVFITGDGCTDNTAEIVNSFNDPRLHFENFLEPEYRNLNKEIGSNIWNIAGQAALNNSLSKCSGEIIARIDDDDYWVPQHLSASVFNYISKSCNVSHTTAILHLNDQQTGELGQDLDKDAMLKGQNHIIHSTISWKNIDKLKGIRYTGLGDIPGDLKMWQDFINLGCKFNHIKVKTVHYFQRCSLSYCLMVINRGI